MPEAVIIEALRTPIARGKVIKGDLSGFHPAQLLAKVMDGVVERAGIDQCLCFLCDQRLEYALERGTDLLVAILSNHDPFAQAASAFDPAAGASSGIQRA